MAEPIELRITLDQQTGVIGVSGPITNKLLCYGMLAVAHDVIRDSTDANRKSPIVSPAPSDVRVINTRRH
jgi:hypothetical protein